MPDDTPEPPDASMGEDHDWHGYEADEDRAWYVDQLRKLDVTERPPPAPPPKTAPSNGHRDQPEQERSTWWPADNPADTGELVPPEPPSIITRTDGLGLFYPGTVNGVHGESGDGKSWLMQAGCLQQMQDARHVWYLDFESRYDEVTQRMLDLGGDWDAIRPFWHYSAPAEPLIVKYKWSRGGLDLAEALDVLDLSFVVIDGVTEAMDLHGLNPLDNGDFAKFRRMLLTRIADAGPCCATVDHVNKDPDTRNNQAMGAQHKRAGMTGAAYGVTVSTAFARGKDGMLKLTCAKDRRGFWPKGKTVAEAHATASEDGSLTIDFQVPTLPKSEDGTFRPTFIMERVSKHLEVCPDGDSIRGVRKSVTGKNPVIDKAIQLLVSEGFIDPTSHATIKPYRRSDDPLDKDGDS